MLTLTFFVSGTLSVSCQKARLASTSLYTHCHQREGGRGGRWSAFERQLRHRLVWEQSRVVLRAVRGARTLYEFPLVSVLRVVSVVRLTLVSCGRSPFCVSGTLRVSRYKTCLASTSLPKGKRDTLCPPHTPPSPLVLRRSGSRALLSPPCG